MEQSPIFDVAFSLSDKNRADSDGLREEDRAFADELERRVQAYEAGQSTADDWDSVAGRLRRELEVARG